jgi:hypothetical protein
LASAFAAGFTLLLALLPATAVAAPPPGLVWSATINGQDVEQSTPSQPVRLGESDQARVVVDLHNRGTSEIQVRSVRIAGRVMGMAFFSYTTRLDIVLPAGQSTQRRFDLDLSDLTREATGLLPATMSLIAPDRTEIDAKAFTVDVRGSVVSVYGAFGLVIAGITAVVLAGLLVAIWRRQLPRNRWQRGIRFMPSGLGLGLVLTFTLSAARLLVPSPVWWLPIVAVCGGGAFLLGYFLPLGSEEADSDAATDPEATIVQSAGQNPAS